MYFLNSSDISIRSLGKTGGHQDVRVIAKVHHAPAHYDSRAPDVFVSVDVVYHKTVAVVQPDSYPYNLGGKLALVAYAQLLVQLAGQQQRRFGILPETQTHAVAGGQCQDCLFWGVFCMPRTPGCSRSVI